MSFNGAQAAIFTRGVSKLGNAGFGIGLSSAPSGATAVLIAGNSMTNWIGNPLPLALWPSGFPGCSLLVSLDNLFTVTVAPSSPVLGFPNAIVPLPIPPSSIYAGATVHFQWFVLSPVVNPPAVGGLSGGLTVTAY